MLDLDHLAEKRARELNQVLEPWRKIIWGADFQTLSQSMSDGEVESLVCFCSSQAELEWTVTFLLQNVSGGSPFSFLLLECEKAGLPPEKWIRSRYKDRGRQ